MIGGSSAQKVVPGTVAAPVLSIVVPCYNEADSLCELYDAMATAFPERGKIPAEFVLVDDGSVDTTVRVMQDLANHDTRVRPVLLRRRGGQTHALWEGLQESRGPWVAHLDGDLQNDPADLPDMLMLAMSENLDAVLGIRTIRDSSRRRQLARHLANLVRQGILGDTIQDIGCSTRIVRRTVLQKLPPIDNLHHYLPALIEKGGWRFTQVPARHYQRKHGVSKNGFLRRALAGFRDLPRMVRYIRSHQAADI